MSGRALGTVASPPTTDRVQVSPRDAIVRFRPKMVLRFQCGDSHRSGNAEVQEVSFARSELTFLSNLNVIIPAICEGDEIYEWKMPCVRCRCEQCEAVWSRLSTGAWIQVPR